MLLLMWLTLVFCFPALGNSSRPEAATKYGVLRGKQTHVEEKIVNIYLGVPFAKPPVGKLRFAPPERPKPWRRPRNAVTYPPACIQPSWGQITNLYFTNQKVHPMLQFEEDCLYLNIYTPAHAQKGSKLPVMVWFPGGAFVVGAASTYDGSVLSAQEDVVVVTIQNRLGILGFFSTGDTHARGNWALLDQLAALQWIQENIAAFGGDPGSVTLFGQSSGSICLSGLILSPLSKGLFHRAISQSGTALLKFFISEEPLKIAKKIAKAFRCDNNSTQALVQCLRSKTQNEMKKVSDEMKLFQLKPNIHPLENIWFIPAVVDGIVFTDRPEVLLAQGNFQKIPYLLGVNSIEFNWLLPHIMKVSVDPWTMTKTQVTKLLWEYSSMLNITKDQIPLVLKEYVADIKDHPGSLNQQLEHRNRFLDLAGDASFVTPAIHTARYHRDAGLPVYFYEFRHHASFAVIVKTRNKMVDHGDEIDFVFGTPLFKVLAQEDEKKLSRNIMKYWANFARTGDPNSDGLMEWPRYEKEEKYMLLDLIQTVGTKLKEKEVAFWTRIQNHHKTHQDGEEA